VTPEEVARLVAGCPDRSVPTMRKVRRRVSTSLTDHPGPAVLELARTLIDRRVGPRWFTYELIQHHDRARSLLDRATLESLGRGMQSWGDVDAFATSLSGLAWREGSLTDADVLRWSTSDDRWWRRTALVSTVPLNVRSRGGDGDPDRTLMVCEALKSDRDDMVVKATSWALRELAKREPARVREFLSDNQDTLAPRIVREVRNKLNTGLKNPTTGRGPS
jgi:3-methyladenine DNA glycosylase AlkD